VSSGTLNLAQLIASVVDVDDVYDYIVGTLINLDTIELIPKILSLVVVVVVLVFVL